LNGNKHDVARKKPLLLCLSHLRWDFVFQRPQHLMTRAAARYRVVFFEEPEFVAAGPTELHLSTRADDLIVARPRLSLADAANPQDASRRLVDALLARVDRRDMIAWYYTPMALSFTSHLDTRLVVYDNMDELSSFRGAPRGLLDLEEALLARADLVFTGGVSLYEAKKHRHARVHAFPSSIDAAHFRVARGRMDEPADQAAIARPRLGFFGVVDERMDLGLVDRVAASRPAWQLVMLGPTAKIDPADLPRRPNIHWLGMKRYEELPAYLAHWDVGFMPFAINEATRYISPTKTPEFLAAGVPVVSTPIADVVRPYGENGLVAIARDAAEAVAAAERLIGRRSSAWLKRVDAHLAGTSWDGTWSRMNRLIEAAQGAGAIRSEAARAAEYVHA
jgi:glycosyltransferase involved in cell wall biosynthesis